MPEYPKHLPSMSTSMTEMNSGCLLCTTNIIHFKWVSGTGLEVWVDQTKIGTIRQGS